MELNDFAKFKKLSGITDVSCDSQADYTLPDYQGDVRRVLLCECSVRPAGGYSDEGGDEFSGIVAYDVIYLDSEGRLTHASFTSDYDLKLRRGDTERTAAYPSVSVASYSVRLTGPRRFSAKATVSADVRCISEDEISLVGTAFETGKKPEALESVLKIRSAAKSEEIEREYAERLERLDGQVADEIEILYCGAEAGIDEVAPEDGSVAVKGTMRMFALVQNGDMPIYLIEKEIPIEESIPFAGVREDMSFIPECRIVSSVAVVNSDDEGAEIALNVIAEYEVLGEYNESVTAVTDAYLVGRDTENTYADYRYTELRDTVNIKETVNMQISASEISADKIREIPYISGAPKIERVEVKDGLVAVIGELKCSGIATVSDDEGNIAYTGIKLSVPFEKHIKLASEAADTATAEYNLSAENVRCAVDTDSVTVDFKLRGVVNVNETRCVSVLAVSNEAETSGDTIEEGTITVYYPTSEDTLFKVAKKFRIGREALAENNGLSIAASADGGDAVLSGIERLYIY